MAYMFNSSRTTKIDEQKLNTFFLEKLAKREKNPNLYSYGREPFDTVLCRGTWYVKVVWVHRVMKHVQNYDK